MLQFVKYVFELNQVEKKTDGIFITFQCIKINKL